MRRYRRSSVENWGWPPLFFNETPLFPPNIPQKSAGIIFWYWCTKRRTQPENQISPQEKKTLQRFLFQNGGYRTLKSSPRKFRENFRKIKFLTKNRHSVSSASSVFVGVKIIRQLYSIFSFWLTRFVFLDVLCLFYIVLYRNLTVWFFLCCHFCVISILFISYWGPMEATFSSWILLSGLNCARELRAYNLNQKDCCSHHLQTWFVEGNFVQQLSILFKSFWLAEKVENSRLSLLTLNDNGEKFIGEFLLR